ncbi:hypothetical protein DFH09DRAFT_1370588 [Mycena vulgaris]|nr:hypothetical protein DFH09DRAFT_1370588 [Mycena vulgaris]
MLTAALPLLFFPLLSGAYAANDWNVACQGDCSYDSPDPVISASLKISGSSHAVSDITAAGGWTILSCDPGSLAQDIRLVCQSSSCEYLFEGHGAIDTLIRLPETCGANAFARVANIQVDSDQFLPQNVRSSIKHAGNITSTVFILSVDTDFAAIDTAKTGPVSFSLEGYNYPVSDLAKRDVRGLKTRNWTAFNSTNSVDLPPLHIDATFPLLTAEVDCTGFSASVSAGFETKVDATVSVGLIVTGTVIPPNITTFAVFGGLNGSILGKLDVLASATGSVDTGKVSLYSVALAGIDFPGIFSLGPTFNIYGELIAELDADVSVSVDLAYDVDGAKMFFPPDTQASGGGFTPGETALTLSVLPGLASNGKVTGRLIPELKLGLEAFTFVEASVYLDLEATASIALDLNAVANATVTGTGKAGANGSVDGCVDIGAAFSVNVGAEGSLFDIISDSIKYPLFSDDWDLYSKCFTASGSTKREEAMAVRTPAPALISSGLASRAELSCPTSSSLTSIEEIIDEIIAAVKAAV